MENTFDRELSWDDEIEHDGEGFTLLPEGDYRFRVLSFFRCTDAAVIYSNASSRKFRANNPVHTHRIG